MTSQEQVSMLIDQLDNVRRAIYAQDTEKELKRQEKVLTIKLETYGVAVQDLPKE